MSITAKIIADSMSPAGHRLTTMQLRYPRFIHSEFMTHRLFSRNASSSRAIPVKKMIEELQRDPAMPVFWGSNKPGMQAGTEVNDVASCKALWLAARDEAIVMAGALMDGFDLHKQIANRLLEPWAHINVVVTATQWANFFELRDHPDAQPEIGALALAMLNAMAGSQPMHLKPGCWHLPYCTEEEIGVALVLEGEEAAYDKLKKISVARCARVSYLTHDGRQTTIEEDMQLFDRLLGSQPLHASPAEHQATPDTRGSALRYYDQAGNKIDYKPDGFDHPNEHGNLTGWRQFRKMLPGEFIPG